MNPNYKTLWDAYIQRGATPAGAAGLLAQVYPESRGNPTAFNPDDGGKSSFGIIQWRGDRQDQLRTFASARRGGANDIMNQVDFKFMELQGSERQAARFLKVDSPEEAGLGFANSFVRPAQQHRAERGPLARAFYEHFVNGTPFPEAMQMARGSQQVGFDPSLGQMPNTTEGVLNQELQTRMNEGSRPQDIMQEIMALAEAQEEELIEPVVPEQEAPVEYGTAPEGLEAPTGPNPYNPAEQAGLMVDDMGGAPSDSPFPNIPLSEGEMFVPENAPPLERPFTEEELSNFMLPGMPPVPEDGDYEAVLDAELPPDPETGQSAARLLNEAMSGIGTDLAYELGVSPDQVPRTVNQVVQAARPPAEPEKEDPERYRKRMFAAEMLQALSIGLGQMAAGKAVDLSGFFAGQKATHERMQDQEIAERERREALAAQQAAQAQAMQERQGFAQQMMQAGMPQLAQLAMTSEDGYKQALSVYGNVQQAQLSRAPTSGMTDAQRREVLTMAGADDETAALLSQFPELTEQYMKQQLLPAQENAARAQEAQTMISSALPYIDRDPRVGPAITRAMANPQSAEALSNLQSILNDVAPEALSAVPDLTPEQLETIANSPQVAANPVLADMIRNGNQELAKQVLGGQLDAANAGAVAEAERTGERRADAEAAEAQAAQVTERLIEAEVITPRQGRIVQALGATEGLKYIIEEKKEEGEREDRARVNEVAHQIGRSFSDPAAQELFSNVQTAQELRDVLSRATELYGVPSDIRPALYMEANPEVRAAVLEYVRARAGVGEGSNIIRDQLTEQIISEIRTDADQLAIRRNLVRSMKGLVEMLNTPGYDATSGPIESTFLQLAQDVATDLFGPSMEGVIRNSTSGDITRFLSANVGEFFQSFRPPGSGAVSDMESRLFMSAMPNITDPVIRQKMLAQRIVNGYEIAQAQLQAQQNYLLENQDDPTKLHDREAMAAYVDNYVDNERGLRLFQTLDYTSPDLRDTAASLIQRGLLSDNEVILIQNMPGKEAAAYVTYGDLIRSLERGRN